MNRSSAAYFLYEFLDKCNEIGVFPQFVNKKNLLFIEKFPLAANFSFLVQLFSSYASIFKNEIAKTFIETIKGLDKEVQKLVLFQFKLDIESKYTGYFENVEWEKMRYENIQDYTKLTLHGYCEQCGAYPFQLDIFEFLKLPFIFTMPSNGRKYFQKIDCRKCGKSDALEIIPSWISTTDNNRFTMYLSDEQITDIHAKWKQENQNSRQQN